MGDCLSRLENKGVLASGSATGDRGLICTGKTLAAMMRRLMTMCFSLDVLVVIMGRTRVMSRL